MTTSTLQTTTIEPADLRELLTAERVQPLILDVRTPAEFETAHIPGSYNVPLDLLDEHRDELQRHLQDQVVLVCRSGGRATQAEAKLAPDSQASLKVLRGGITAWEQAGGRVNRGRPRWDLERQVRLVAGSVVLASMVASLAFPAAQWLAAAVGAGLAVAALTNTCTLGMLLGRLPYNRGALCDVQGALAGIAAAKGPQS